MSSLSNSDFIALLMACVAAAQVLAGAGFIVWLYVRQKRSARKRRHLLQRHARLQSHPRGWATPELLQAILGIGLMIALALAMVAGFADSPRW